METDEHATTEVWMTTLTFFSICFAIELGIKIFAFGLIFFTDNFNIFDLIIVSLSWVEITLLWHAYGTGKLDDHASDYGGMIGVFRLLRLARLFRIIQFFERLNSLAVAFYRALQDIVWVGILIIFVLYVFGVLATNALGNNEFLTTKLAGSGLVPDDLFGSTPRSMLTLFQIMTLDSWMSSITRPVGDVGAFPFFIIFTFLAALGLLNLLTAIFVESLAEVTKGDDNNKVFAPRPR